LFSEIQGREVLVESCEDVLVALLDGAELHLGRPGDVIEGGIELHGRHGPGASGVESFAEARDVSFLSAAVSLSRLSSRTSSASLARLSAAVISARLASSVSMEGSFMGL